MLQFQLNGDNEGQSHFLLFESDVADGTRQGYDRVRPLSTPVSHHIVNLQDGSGTDCHNTIFVKVVKVVKVVDQGGTKVNDRAR